MDIPKYIQESMIKSAKHSEIARENNERVRTWLEREGIDDKLGVIDALIDSLEVGYNPQYLIDFIEKEKWNYTEGDEIK